MNIDAGEIIGTLTRGTILIGLVSMMFFGMNSCMKESNRHHEEMRRFQLIEKGHMEAN